jgi:two-component system chemotaxis sensor kinase CheA
MNDAALAPSASLHPDAAQHNKTPDNKQTQVAESSPVDHIVRIDANKLNALLHIVGESVHAASHANILLKKLLSFKLEGAIAGIVTGLAEALGQVSRHTTDLQRATLTTRMQPAHTLFHKIATYAETMTLAQGFHVDLHTAGAHTEIDLDILESMHQPLRLIIDNIVARAIKAAHPHHTPIRIDLHARQGASSVMLEIRDHEQEIDRASLYTQASQANHIPHDQTLSDDEILQLIFAPGITDTSGQTLALIQDATTQHRGVAHVSSSPDNTRFLLRFPIDLSIIPTMVVRTANTAFALPMVTVERIITLPDTLDSVHDVPVLRDQGRPLPVRSLAGVLGYPRGAERLGIIIAAPEPYVLTVEDIEGTTDLIIKPLTAVQAQGVTGTSRSSLGEMVLVVGVVFLLDGCRTSRLSTTMR